MRLRAWSVPLVLSALASVPLAASGLREHRFDAVARWERAEVRGLAMSADGSLELAPALRALNLGNVSPPPYLLCQARDSEGNFYVGAAGPARVFRFTPHGNATLLFQGEEMQVNALAIDSKDRLHVATSPRGRVYRLNKSGEARPFFEPEERYIWSLWIDAGDTLWVGTGERGRLFRVDARGRSKLVLDSPEAHITALAPGADGTLLAGTDGHGRVYRIGGDGETRTIFEGGLRQVSALAESPDGRMYVALVGTAAAPEAKERQQRDGKMEEFETVPLAPFDGQPPLPLAEEAPPATLRESLEPPPQAVPQSRILELDRRGAARELWRSEGTWLHTLALDASGTLYFGTGEPARLHRLDAPHRTTRIAELKARHLTSIAAADGRLILLSGRPGRVLAAGKETAKSGSLQSAPFDTGSSSRWGRVRWRADAPAGTQVELFSRSGNSARPDAGWSEWSAAYVDSSGSTIISPPGRYLQWRLALERGRQSASPRLQDLSFSYLPANRPPRIERVTLHPPGEYFLPGDGNASPGRRRQRAGLRTLSWRSTDPDGDPLSANVKLRRSGASEWSSLAHGVLASYYSWSVAHLREGWYEVLLELSDAGANPPQDTGRTAAAPLAFKIDHTPPTIQIGRHRLQDSPPQLEFSVVDELSPVHGVRIWIDRDPPQRLVPVDGLEDSRREEYVWQASTPPHRLRLEAADTEGNRAEWRWPSGRPVKD
ncbi:MAG: hypothetical protein V3U98_01925 [Acidobacteriota bacterium]